MTDVISLTVIFFMSFHFNSLNDKIRSNKVIISNIVLQYVVDLKF